MMGQAGYSSTPLPRKLGLKDGQAVAFVGLPHELSDLADAQAFAFVETPSKCEDMTGTGLDFIQFFTSSATLLFPLLCFTREYKVKEGAEIVKVVYWLSRY